MFVFVCVGTASANTYCVPTGGGAGCFNSGALDLQSALTLAQANPGPDTVKVAAISLLPVDCTTAGFSYSGATNNPLTLTGAGTTQTFLTCQNNYNNQPNHFTPILSLDGAATVSDMQIHLPSGLHDRGLKLTGGAAATNVDVVSDLGASGSAIGVEMVGGRFTSGLIGIPLTDNGDAVFADSGASISDVSLTSGGNGLRAVGNPDVTLTRAEISAPRGVVSEGFGVQVSDVAIDPIAGAGPVTDGGLVIDDMGSAGPFSITARNVSIGGHLANSYGVYVAATTVGETATVNLTDSVIHGPTTALHRSAVAGATANLTTSYDAYPAGN